MKYKNSISIVALIFFSLNVCAQKSLSEGSIVYNISVETGSSQPKMADMLDGATTTIYLKGSQSRTELVSGLGSEATIYNSTTGNGVILKEYSGQKLMITLTAEDWIANNKKYEGITFENTGDTANISGFHCEKATAKLKDGTSFIVYYTKDVEPLNKNYDAQFKTLPGLAVQYEMQTGKMKSKFTLSKVNYTAIPSSKFDIPKSGYRIMTYAETKTKSVNQ